MVAGREIELTDFDGRLLAALLCPRARVYLLDGFVLFKKWCGGKPPKNPVNTFQSTVSDLKKKLGKEMEALIEIRTGDKDDGYWWELHTKMDSNISAASAWLEGAANALHDNKSGTPKVDYWSGLREHIVLLSPARVAESLLFAAGHTHKDVVSGAFLDRLRQSLHDRATRLAEAILKVVDLVRHDALPFEWHLVRHHVRPWVEDLGTISDALCITKGKVPESTHAVPPQDIDDFVILANTYRDARIKQATVEFGRRPPRGFHAADGQLEAIAALADSEGTLNRHDAPDSRLNQLRTELCSSSFYNHLIEGLGKRFDAWKRPRISHSDIRSVLFLELPDWVARQRLPLLAHCNLLTFITGPMKAAIVRSHVGGDVHGARESPPEPETFAMAIASLLDGVSQRGDADSILNNLSTTISRDTFPQQKQFTLLYDVSTLLESNNPGPSEIGRHRGPIMQDFAEGIPYRRERAIADLQTQALGNTVSVLIGARASGKTVLIRQLAFDLRHVRPVWWFTCKREFDPALLAREINDSTGIIFLDDAEWAPQRCQEVCARVKPGGRHVVVSTRRSALDHQSSDWRSFTEYPCMSLESNSVCSAIAKHFAERLGVTEISDNECDNLATYAEDDLWLLSFAIRGWVLSHGKGEFDEWAQAPLVNELNELERRFGTDEYARVLVAIAPFSMHGSYIQERHLTDTLGFNRHTLSTLVQIGELQRESTASGDAYMLHHSSLGGIYWNCNRFRPSEDGYAELLYEYTVSGGREALAIISQCEKSVVEKVFRRLDAENRLAGMIRRDWAGLLCLDPCIADLGWSAEAASAMADEFFEADYSMWLLYRMEKIADE